MTGPVLELPLEGQNASSARDSRHVCGILAGHAPSQSPSWTPVTQLPNAQPSARVLLQWLLPWFLRIYDAPGSANPVPILRPVLLPASDALVLDKHAKPGEAGPASIPLRRPIPGNADWTC